MPPIVFKLSYAGLTELMLSPEFAADMNDRAAKVEAQAKEISPVVTGNYQDNITSGTFHDGDRVTGYAQAGADYSIDVEVREHVLTRAIDAGGDS